MAHNNNIIEFKKIQKKEKEEQSTVDIFREALKRYNRHRKVLEEQRKYNNAKVKRNYRCNRKGDQ